MNKVMFAQVTKVDAATRTVTGVMVSQTPDAANEIFDYDSSAPLFKAWSENVHKTSGGKSYGNVRAMHQPISAGKLIEFTPDDVAKNIVIKAEIVDDKEWEKVEKGVYTGFSFGGKYIKKWKDPNDATKTRYTASCGEVSLADLPCVPDATFDLTKLDGTHDVVKFVQPTAEELEARKAVIAGKQLERAKKLYGGELTKHMKPEHVGVAKALLAKITDTNVVMSLDFAAKALDKTQKTNFSEDVQKGMWSISRLSDLICSLDWLTDDTEMEAEIEGDGSPLPDMLKTALRQLCEALVSMAQEETAELLGDEDEEVETIVVVEMTAGADNDAIKLAVADVKKSISAMDPIAGFEHVITELATVRTALKALGYDDVSKVADVAKLYTESQLTVKKLQGDVTKLDKTLHESVGAMEAARKTAKDATAKLDEANKEIAALKALPAASKPRLSVVGKEGDTVDIGNDADKVANVKKTDGSGDVDDAATAIKKIHSAGGRSLVK